MVRATQSIHKSHHVPDVPPRTAVSPRRVEVVVLVLAVSLCVLPLWLVKGAEPDVIAAVVVGHELALSAAISNGIRTAATGRRTHTERELGVRIRISAGALAESLRSRASALFILSAHSRVS